jgi:hypothetical protein
MSARAVPPATRRLERLAAFTFAATLAVTGCAAAGDESEDQQESEIGSIMPMYGLPPPPVDAGTPTTDGGTPTTDGGTPTTDGGTPTTDGGTPCTPAGDGGGFHAMYGAPPLEPCPAPTTDGGGMMPMYGLPPGD